MSTTGRSEPESTPERFPDREEPMMYCPACDTKLSQSRCKLQCEKCGYYMSCADYY